MVLYKLNGSNGQLYVYEDHIVIERKGILGKLTHLTVKDTNLNFLQIDFVKFRLGNPLFSGYFYFHRKGDDKDCSLVQAAMDKDCIVFRFFENKKAKEIKKFIDGNLRKNDWQNVIRYGN